MTVHLRKARRIAVCSKEMASVDSLLVCVCVSQPFSKKAVDHVQSHLAKKQVPPSLFQVRQELYLICTVVSVGF